MRKTDLLGIEEIENTLIKTGEEKNNHTSYWAIAKCTGLLTGGDGIKKRNVPFPGRRAWDTIPGAVKYLTLNYSNFRKYARF